MELEMEVYPLYTDENQNRSWPSGSGRFRRDPDEEVAIIGVRIHKFGRFDSKSYLELGQKGPNGPGDALQWKDIQMAYLSKMYLPATSGADLKPLGPRESPFAILKRPARRDCLKPGDFGDQSELSTWSVWARKKCPGIHGSFRSMKNSDQMGMDTNPSYWAMRARRHMHEYGTTDLHLARWPSKTTKTASIIYAMYRKEFTLEEIMNSPGLIPSIS
jgi:hypothetical protein